MQELIYVAEDGSWGSAKGLLFIDAARWSDKDYDDLGEAPDSERMATAQAILRNRHEKPLHFATLTPDEEAFLRQIITKIL